MKQVKRWIIILGVTLLFYGTSVRYGFSQDDFFHLVISRANALRDVVAFFVPSSANWVFYRPVSTQLWYYLFDTIFGYWRAPVPMHIAALLLHATNAYLVMQLLSRVFKIKDRLAMIGGALYAASGIHFLSLFYIGATQQLLATFFCLLAIVSNLNNQKVREVVFFVFALLSKEVAIRLVPIAIIIRLIKGDKLSEAIKRSWPTIGVSLIYLAIRYSVGITTPVEYSFDLSPLTTMATVMWYGLMNLGAPEAILTYGLSAGRVDFVAYVRDFSTLGVLNLIAIGVVAIGILLSRWSRRYVLYAMLWVLSLAPVLLLPTHRYAHYLDLALLPMIAILLSQKTKWMTRIVVASYVVAAITGQALDRRTHWTIARSEISTRTISFFHENDVCFVSNSVYIYGSSEETREVQYALAGENAGQIICDNPEFRTYYTDDRGEIPKDAHRFEAWDLLKY